MNATRELAFPNNNSWKQFRSNWRRIVSGAIFFITEYPIKCWKVIIPRLKFALFKQSVNAPIKTPEGFTIRTNAEMLVYTATFIEHNLYHPPMVDDLITRLFPEVIDVGYNCGMVTRWLGQYNERAEFTGIEVLPQMIVRAGEIDGEMANPPKTTIHWAAGWSGSGEEIPISIGSRVSSRKNSDERESFKVPTIAVDDLKKNGLFLLKIDTDGSNVQVLEGARETLKNTRWLLIEEEDGVLPWIATNLQGWQITRLTCEDLILKNNNIQ